MNEISAERVLVVYGSWHGQTARVAERIAVIGRDRGYDVEVMSVDEAWRCPTIRTFHRFIVCAGVHGRHHHRKVEAFIARYECLLSTRPSVFVSVSLTAAEPPEHTGRAGLEHAILSLSRRTHWWPSYVILVAGALAYTRYNPLTRWIMKRISKANDGPTDTSRDHELTDWLQLERDIDEVLPRAAQSLRVTTDAARQLRAGAPQTLLEPRTGVGPHPALNELGSHP